MDWIEIVAAKDDYLIDTMLDMGLLTHEQVDAGRAEAGSSPRSCGLRRRSAGGAGRRLYADRALGAG